MWQQKRRYNLRNVNFGCRMRVNDVTRDAGGKNRVRGLHMRLVAAAVCATSFSWHSRSSRRRTPGLLQLAVWADGDGVAPRAKDEQPRATASFECTRSQQERVIGEVIKALELHDDIKRHVELKTLQSPLTTVLDLSRCLTGRGYKRADRSPLLT